MEQQELKEKCHILSKHVGDPDIKTINGVRFTDREIDIIACLLSRKAYKKIASILAISPKTVEMHIHNIMLRLGCNSRENIIDFIEKSDKLAYFRELYSNLLIKEAFELELKKIASLLPNSIKCLIFYYKKQRAKDPFIGDLEKHLNVIGIKTISKVWEKDKSESFLTSKTGHQQVSHIIYVISDEYIEHLKSYDLKEEANNLIPLIKKSTVPIIFLLLNRKNLLPLDKGSSVFACVDIKEQRNYYFLIFELLKRVFPGNHIDKNINEFAKQYEISQNSASLQKWSKGNNLEADAINMANNKKAKKKFSWKWIIFFISPICFSFVVFNINKEIIFLTNKSQDLESRLVTAGNKDMLTKTQQKTVIFNLPPRNSKFTGRQGVLKRIEKQLSNQKFGVITQSIVGLGGIGKTQLATEYAYLAAEKNKYKAILYVTAETPCSINNAYREFADLLQIDIRDLTPNEIQRLVHRTLAEIYEGSKILFIIDNAATYDDIQEYIGNLNKQFTMACPLHILITSRSQWWPGNQLILDTFTKQEAIIFIKKYLQNEDEESIVKLIKTLYYFPLALGQATAYIKTHTNINDYLELYSRKQKDYLDKFLGDKNQYTESLWKTWDIALTKLSTAAKEILYISAYLYPDNIPIAFFDDLSVEDRGNAIEDLKKHSFIIISHTNKSFKIHRLLQEVIRMSIKKKTSVLTRALHLIKNKFAFSYTQIDKWSACGQYIMHAQYLAKYLTCNKSEFFPMGLQLYAKVVMYLAYAQQDITLATKNIKKVKILVKQYYNKDNSCKFILANINTHLGFLFRQLGDMNQAKKYLEKAVAIYKTRITSNSMSAQALLTALRWESRLTVNDGMRCDRVFALNTLGNVNRDLGNFTLANDFYEEALGIINEFKTINATVVYKIVLLRNMSDLYKSIGEITRANNILNSVKTIADENFPNHPEQAFAYERIAYLLYYMSRYNEAKEILKKCLRIRMTLHSEEHYRIGHIKFMLGLIFCAKNNINKGLVYLKQAEIIYKKNFADNHIRFILPYIYMHYALEKNKDYKQALKYLIKAKTLALQHWGDRTPAMLAYQLSPIEQFPTIDKSEKNIDYYIQALGLIKQLFGKNHIRTAYYNYLAGRIYENNHDKINARKYYQEAINIAKKQHFNDKELITGNQNNIDIIQMYLK